MFFHAKHIAVLGLVLVAVVSCGGTEPESAPVPVATEIPTQTASKVKAEPTATAIPEPTLTPTEVPPTPTPAPVATATLIPEPTPTEVPPTSTPVPTSTPTPLPTETPTPEPIPTPTLTPVPLPTATPTSTPTPTPTATPTATPTPTPVPYTEVGGIISSDTVWTVDDSPYAIIETVQIAHGATLQIGAGVEINCIPSLDNNNGLDNKWPNYRLMFRIAGNLVAEGTEILPIVFQTNGLEERKCTFLEFNKTSGYASLENVHVKRMLSLGSSSSASLTMTNSVVSSMEKESNLIPRTGDSVVYEMNIFDGASFLIETNVDAYNIIFRNNRFEQPSYGSPFFAGTHADNNGTIAGYISVSMGYSTGLIVENNSFVGGCESNCLNLSANFDNYSSIGDLDARNNYWEKLAIEEIGEKVFDKHDDTGVSRKILYQPFLTEPHTDTP